MNPRVDAYLGKATQWRAELKKLRAILLGCGLGEELKWGKPCYTFDKHNVALLLPLKNYCSVLFMKGGLLKNAGGILVKAGENAESGRQGAVCQCAGDRGEDRPLESLHP